MVVSFLQTFFYLVLSDTSLDINELKQDITNRGFRVKNYLYEDVVKVKYGSISNNTTQIVAELEYIEKEYKKYGLQFFSVIAKKGSNE